MRLTKKELIQFKRGWKIVNEAELKELKSTTPEKKLRQLSILMKWVKDFGWQNILREEEGAVRKRWIKLKRLYSGQTK